jgi:hypothetical protein
MSVFDTLMKYLAGRSFFGRVNPRNKPRPLPAYDARTHALGRFADFLASLEWSRRGNVGEPDVSYRIPREDVYEDQPDDPANLNFPSLAFLPARGTHDQYTLGPCDVIEESYGQFGKGTVLLLQGEYIELFMVEAWGSHVVERRSILAGIQAVIRMNERSNALQLSLPAYYNRVASFSLVDSTYIDDPDVVRGRRRGQVAIELRVPEVILVDAITMRPCLCVEVVDELCGQDAMSTCEETAA